jgi:RNA polymerase sigma factor (sigma-70 family)
MSLNYVEPKLKKIERLLLPHADAAYNLARWLTRNDQDASDVVQEAYLRAFRFIDTLKADDGKAWLLQIVRNTAFTWIKRYRTRHSGIAFDEETHGSEEVILGPEELVLQQNEKVRVHAALETLPHEYREVLVLRELEEMSYQEIAQIVEIPVGTVMSRLARGRAKLLECIRKKEI